MNGVMANTCMRKDVLLRRGCANDFGVRWQERIPGEGTREKDLTGWSATLEMSYMGETVYSQPCMATQHGLVIAEVPSSAFDGSDWASRASGEYRISATEPDGETYAVMEGLWHLS